MNEARYLWTIAAEVSATIGRWLEENEGKRFYARFKTIDQLRLTRLQVWSYRHKVSVYEILTLTLPYLRASLSTKEISRFKLGCSIAALTGRGNEKILIEALHQKYPGAEHRDIWREAERQMQLDRESAEENDGLVMRPRAVKGLFESDSVRSYLESYRGRMITTREKMRAQRTHPKRRRKHYRGNPWI